MADIITSSLFYGAVGAALIELVIAVVGTGLMGLNRIGRPEFGDEEYDD